MTELGLGFMRYDLYKFKQYEKLMDYAINNHISYFETATFYLDNKCEEFVFNLLSPYARDTYEYSGKLALKTTQLSDVEFYKNEYLKSLEAAPGRYFDTYLFQSLTPATLYFLKKNKEEIKSFFFKELAIGRIKKMGVCLQCSFDILEEFFKEYKDIISIVQMPLNYFTWTFSQGKEKYYFLKENNIDIIAQAPFNGGNLITNSPLLSDINPIEALHFVIRKNPYKILVGTQNLEHLKFLNKAFEMRTVLSDDDIEKLLLKNKDYFKIKDCINCNLCAYFCNKNIPIPIIFDRYNAALDNPKNFKDYTKIMHLPDFRRECIKCYQCEYHCPQHIEIVNNIYNKIYNFYP